MCLGDHKTERSIQDDPRFDDGGFSEEGPNDERLYDRSFKINPTDLPSNPRYEMPPDVLIQRLIGPFHKTRST
ncbi:MAG: hypothetical protein J0H94_21210 [Rhizobiales bacterium]|nr:hypothetical protein [Hyphomicrobiales bacterium]